MPGRKPRKRTQPPSRAVLAQAVFQHEQRIQALENARGKQPIGFKPPDAGEYEGSVPGDHLPQHDDSFSPDGRAPAVLRVRRRRSRRRDDPVG